MAKAKTDTLLGEVGSLDDVQATGTNWFTRLDADTQVQLIELCKDFLAGGVTRRKFASATTLYSWLEKKGIVKVKADRFRTWLRELGNTVG